MNPLLLVFGLLFLFVVLARSGTDRYYNDYRYPDRRRYPPYDPPCCSRRDCCEHCPFR